ncbi:Pyrimidine-nucleoside phosphorylase [Planctomycetes bacterium Poly30]|uniref:thymidine phosphorylase n=1 Tax=Saltatorellus ferox TaxID=2528018 RepID=A0A518EYK3_9BACT|nr:Pyrimidine-nucleoside phosphorylase [Planctomycetes bacterium Poly30]
MSADFSGGPLDGATLKRILGKKRDGGALSAEESLAFLHGVADGSIGEPEQVALLASIWFRGMTPSELSGWTTGMVDSGHRLDLSGFDAPKVDKHSTGGIGDKVSLPLAPALAALGCIVPMISGRGLGHTGGTLDKLEAVPGVMTGLDEAAIGRVLREAGCVICAQTRSIAPSDRVLYALRDRVELVESLPLIASSIVSKKVAEDIDALVLDVKTGSGAFLVDIERGRELGQTMVDLAAAAGVRASARITSMARPLGRAVGHTLEIEETVAALRGEGPKDLVEITVAFGADLLVAVGLESDHSAASAAVLRVLGDGSALEHFDRMLRAQGASVDITGATLERAPDVVELKATAAGHLGFGDVRQIGYAVRDLGGGRAAPGDVIDPAVGVVWQHAAGAAVDAGDVLALVHHRGGHGLEAALERLNRAVTLDGGAEIGPLLIERIEPSGRV